MSVDTYNPALGEAAIGQPKPASSKELAEQAFEFAMTGQVNKSAVYQEVLEAMQILADQPSYLESEVGKDRYRPTSIELAQAIFTEANQQFTEEQAQAGGHAYKTLKEYMVGILRQYERYLVSNPPPQTLLKKEKNIQRFK